jgi:hypothetical protein
VPGGLDDASPAPRNADRRLLSRVEPGQRDQCAPFRTWRPNVGSGACLDVGTYRPRRRDERLRVLTLRRRAHPTVASGVVSGNRVRNSFSNHPRTPAAGHRTSAWTVRCPPPFSITTRSAARSRPATSEARHVVRSRECRTPSRSAARHWLRLGTQRAEHQADLDRRLPIPLRKLTSQQSCRSQLGRHRHLERGPRRGGPHRTRIASARCNGHPSR